MEKSILRDYIDACELIKETEEDIRKLKKMRKTIVQSVVKGSMQGFPYSAQNFHIEGISHSVIEHPGQLSDTEKLLAERQSRAADIKAKAEAFLNTAPVRMQRIIRFKIFQRLSWEGVATRMGRKSTPDSVRMEFYNFMKEK